MELPISLSSSIGNTATAEKYLEDENVTTGTYHKVTNIEDFFKAVKDAGATTVSPIQDICHENVERSVQCG